MAKSTTNTAQSFKAIRSSIESGDIKPVYLLFGKEHYYIDELCNLLIDKVVPPEEKDFGQIVLYGAETSAAQVVSTARQFPMMVQRQLVVVKEAQMMRNVEDIAVYFDGIMPSTVLVICFKTSNDPMKAGKNIDKRKALYKKAQQYGVAFESAPVEDYRMAKTIEAFVADRGLKITPDGAQLLAEFAGTQLQKIDLELDKLLKVMPAGKVEITAEDIEKNVGMSRDYSIYELTKALSLKDRQKCFRIVHFYGEASKRYPFVVIMGSLASHFMKLLRYGALVQEGMPRDRVLAEMGINPFFAGEYDAALRNYPVKTLISDISLLRQYDVKSKSNGRGSAEDGELLTELVAKLLG